jgi:hypothetical protein
MRGDSGHDGASVREGAARINRAFRNSLAVIGIAAVAVLAVVSWRSAVPLRAPGTAEVPPPADPVIRDRPVRDALGDAVRYRDVTRESGIVWERSRADPVGRLLPDALGGGVAILDADGDGMLDLMFTDACEWTGEPFASEPRTGPGARSGAVLMRCVGLDPLRYEDVTRAAGIDVPMHGTGVATGDVDGDGRDDALVAGVGRVALLLNRSEPGSAKFVDATDEWGLGTLSGDPDGSWFTSVGFLDADGDGDLDLVLARYVRWSPQIDAHVDYRIDGIVRAYGPPTGYEGLDLVYMRNDGGRFTDASAEAGMMVRNASTGVPVSKALGLCFLDADGDGDLDILVANDTTANFLLANDGSGRFAEMGARAGIAYDRHGAATGAMGIDAAWLRSDPGSDASQDVAIAIGNFANEPDSLYVSRGRTPAFSDDAAVEGIAAPTRAVLTFGLAFTDADLDGHIDLVQANGHLEPEVHRFLPSQSFAQRGQLFMNASRVNGGAAPILVEILAPAAGTPCALRSPWVGRGLAVADLDGDGDEDIVLTQMWGPPAVLVNGQDTGHAWIAVDLKGPAGNRAAIGAEIELHACGTVQRRTVSGARSYQSAMPATAVFGLGECDTVDAVHVRWPDGSTSSHVGIKPGQRITLPARSAP